MKKLIVIFPLILLTILLGQQTKAQVGNVVKESAKENINNQAANETNEVINDAAGKIKQGIGSLFHKKHRKKKKKAQNQLQQPDTISKHPVLLIKTDSSASRKLSFLSVEGEPGIALIMKRSEVTGKCVKVYNNN